MNAVLALAALTVLMTTGAKERAEAAGVQGPSGRRLAFVRSLANSTSLVAGETLRLECAAAFDPMVSPPSWRVLDDALRRIVKFRWYHNKTQLYTNSLKNVTDDGVVSSTLTLNDIGQKNQGYYSCMIIDGKRKIRSDTVVNIAEPRRPETTAASSTSSIWTSPILEPDSPGSTFSLFDSSIEPEVTSSIETHPGLCQPYIGNTCAKFLGNHSVFIPYKATQTGMEDKLTTAFGVISFSNEISINCEKYALPSICFSTFPICRTPEDTNEKFFQYLKSVEEGKVNAIRKSSYRTVTDDDEADGLRVQFENLPAGKFPPFSNPATGLSFFNPYSDHSKRIRKKSDSERRIRSVRENNKLFESRDTVPLRRVCRKDCELLENELCQKEYAIAKRHPDIGQKLALEECANLPIESYDCLEIGIEKHVDPDDTCYWESGIGYKGVMNAAVTGLPCVQWSHQFKYKIADHLELLGHNYCRNPGGMEIRPWCFVEKDMKLEKQLCEVPKCSQKIWIYIISGIAMLGVSLASCLIWIFCRHRNSKNDTAAIRNINLPNADKNIYGNSRLNSPIELTDLLSGQHGAGNGTGSRSDRILRVPQYKLSQIKFVEELGEGAFGKVYKGELVRDDGSIFVAVKALKENASPKTQSDFRREIELISELHHENIVCILGVILREEPLCMLFEFMAKGDLHEFLVSRAPPDGARLTSTQFLNICHHIASGMEYLAAHHYVHRDLAARNCLVADNLIVKISDFGLSRDIYSSDYYRVQSKSLLPVRWMPPESILYGKFTTESDVWSYGIVLWEIYSYGLQPYYGYSNQEVISMVRGRELLQCPAECPRAVYLLIRECWHQTAARRPNFTTICHRLTDLKLSISGIHGDNTSESSSAVSGPRAPISLGDPRERMPLISHHSSSNGSLAGTMPRKLSIADSIRSHASTRLMVSSSDVTSGSDNCENSVKVKKSSCGSLLDEHPSNSTIERQRELVMKTPTSQPYGFKTFGGI